MVLQNSPPSTPSFDDARSCKAWLQAIPLTNVFQAQQKIYDALRVFNAGGEITPIDRLTCVELMRDKIAYLLGEQRKRYQGKTIPLSSAEFAAWEVSIALIAEMESGYRRCLADALDASAPLAAHAALIMQRIVRYIGLAMLMHSVVYRRFDHGLWARLHAQWQMAEQRELTSLRVKDTFGTAEGNSSIEQATVAVLLCQLSANDEMSAREIDFTDAVMQRFGHKVRIERNLVANAHGVVCAVDLAAEAGAAFRGDAPAGEQWRMLNTADLSKSLRRRQQKLAEGEDLASLGFPADWNVADAQRLLTRLHRAWCDGTGAAVPTSVPKEPHAQVVFGIVETHFFQSGDIFEQPGARREISRQEMSDIAFFGRVSMATTQARGSELNFVAERWRVIDESRRTLRLQRPLNSAHGVAIGNLLGINLGGLKGNFYLGVISALEEQAEQIAISLTMLPGKPQAVALRAGDPKGRANANYVQGFLLPALSALRVPETLLLPPNLVQKGRVVEVVVPGVDGPRQATVQALVQRGADFERVAIA